MILSIREIATKLKVHEQTLRHWEKLGLLKVSRLGTNRTRVYSSEDLDLCRKIASFSDKGINLRGIKALLSLGKNSGSFREKLLIAPRKVKKKFSTKTKTSFKERKNVVNEGF
jgi:MerR family transcriptional regulator/heat shock protein HspR